jgi:Protein of unknown function (DUF2510)
MTAPLPPRGWYPDPSGAPGQRDFDGADWTEHRAPALARLPDYGRSARLDVAVAQDVAMGARLAARTPLQAVMIYGGKVGGATHVVFALFTIFICGLAVIPWIIVAATSNERRVTLSVDPYGKVTKA